jgi:acyl carrier protein
VIGEVLGRPVSRDDNLYALGADSLRLVRIVARLRSRLGVEVPIAELLHRADVADLLALVARGAHSPEEDPAFLAQLRSLYEDVEPPA